MSGLLTRSLPLALMGSADQVPICFAGNGARDIRRSVLIVAAEWHTITSLVLLSRGRAPSHSACGLEWLRGVSPNHAANSRPLLNCRPDPIVAATAEAVTGPTPGIVCRS